MKTRLYSPTLLTTILELAPVGICITNSTGRFAYVNPAYGHIYGYPVVELTGRSFLTVVQPAQHALLQQLHDRFIAGQDELDSHWRVVRADGSLIDISARARRFIGLDGAVYKATLVQDITEPLRLERQKEGAQALVFAELLNLTEETRGLAQDPVLDGIPKRYSQEMQRALNQIRDLILTNRDLALIEEGQFRWEPQPQPLRPLLEGLTSGFEALARVYETSLVLDWQAPSPEGTIFAPAHLVQNLLANLVKNAIEASPPASEVRLGLEVDGGDWLFRVRNQGDIPEALRPRFFEAYNTTKQNGTGLGTYSARLCARALGGRLWFTTGSGETELWFRLPQPKIPRA